MKLGTIACLELGQGPFFLPIVPATGRMGWLAFSSARLVLSQHTIGFLSGILVVLFTASVLPCLSEKLPEPQPQRAEDQPQIAPDGLYSDVNTAKELADVKITLTAKELAEMDGRFLPDSTER